MATEIRVLSTMLAAWHSSPSEHQLSGRGGISARQMLAREQAGAGEVVHTLNPSSGRQRHGDL